ncbi:MAG: DUF368 domain-containing protein [Eubacteriales bacterium]
MKDYAPKNLAHWIAYVFRGALIGIGGILPGISGGVLCVAFGIYKPMMEMFSHPLTGVKRYYKMFIPIAIGGLSGFFALSGLIASLLEAQSTVVISTFIGLILGVFPSLFREAGQEGRTYKAWIALVISTCLLTAFFMGLQLSQAITITPNLGWYLFCGVLWGGSIIVPGMSSSSLLLFLNLYQPLTDGISRFDLTVLVPFGVGVLGTVLLAARGVEALFKRHYSVTFHCIIGFVIASTLPIVPLSFISTSELITSVVCASIGFVIAYFMDKWGQSQDRNEDTD